ncbi:MAG: LytR/AlgR family response regulator transcription factor [Cyclobacteriaceae bacterium]
MRVIIIEDELPAQAKLRDLLKQIDHGIEVTAVLDSVKESVQWLRSNPTPDLAFVDIRLSDDHSFEIFRQVPVAFPIVFTTAFDKYLMESFEFNSVDYLLKPITEEKLRRSLDKMKQLERHFLQGNLFKILEHIQAPGKTHRIVAKKGTEFIALNLSEIAYFFTDHKIVFARDFQGRQLIVDQTLADLEAKVDPGKFFRVNRKYLCALNSIEKFKPDNGRIHVSLNPDPKETVHVSKETAPQFRTWVAQG